MVFRDIRRKERALTGQQAEAILSAGQYGVLSVQGDEGYPYGVPMNYGYFEGKVYLHAAMSGHKLDAIYRSLKVCFTVVSRHELVEAEYTAAYESVIVFGKARILAEEEEKRSAMTRMMGALAPAMMGDALENCGSSHYVMIEITPEHISGKSNRR